MSPRIHTSRQALFVIRGEICLVIAGLRKSARWSSHQQDSKQDALLKKLQALKDSLDSESKGAVVKISADANYFLTPFLEVVRSEDTSGAVTVLALSSIEKFVSYEIVSEVNGSSGAVEAITNAVIHARFVSSDSASDELVFLKILQVLHRLFMSNLGTLLSNESVCELMQSCFRMCFIERANELLRKSAESALTEMICLLFSRLHSFPIVESIKKNRSSTASLMSASAARIPIAVTEESSLNLNASSPTDENNPIPIVTPAQDKPPVSATTSASNLPEIQVQEATPEGKAAAESTTEEVEGSQVAKPATLTPGEFKTKRGVKFTVSGNDATAVDEIASPTTPTEPTRAKITVPYGIPCVRELFRFLISIVNPHSKQNTDIMIHVGLKLLLVALETGVDSMAKHAALLSLVKNELCKNMIALLGYQPPPNSFLTSSSILLNVLRGFLLLFDSMRHLLKFQLEVFFTRLGELVTESGATGIGGSAGPPTVIGGTKWNYEQRELGLDFLVQIWKLPCLVTELYLNYDCDLYCSNLFEDTTKLLSKNAFSLQSGINSLHLLCLEGLVSILDGIENHCTHRITSAAHSSIGSDESNCSSVFYCDSQDQYPHLILPPSSVSSVSLSDEKVPGSSATSKDLPDESLDLESHDEATPSSGGDTVASTSTAVNKTITGLSPQPRRGYVNTGSNRVSEETLLPTHEELMAIRHKKKILHTGSEHFNTKASKGIEFLQSQGLLSEPLDPTEVAHFLRENPLLDKRAIGDYVSAKKNSQILRAFVKSFDFSKTRVDEALRLFLETFRLPGEAPLISFIMEEFSEHWSQSNGNPFADVDAAYRLGYAVIMLNVDQHNTNVKKNGTSMTWEDFKKNLRGLNGGEDFNHEMLHDIYSAIKNEEIIMPAEQTGLVKDNYMWKVLLKRGTSSGCRFQRPFTDEGVFDHDLFSLGWGPIVAALSFIFDKTTDSEVISKCLAGFRKCATISAHYGMSDVFDNLVISLCKFTTMLSTSPDLGGSKKAQAACRAVFQHVHRHGDILREGWRNFVDCLVALFKLQVLPKILTESEDFTEPSGRVSLVRRTVASVPRAEPGLFSSIYSVFALSAADSNGSKSSIADEEENRKRSQTLITECRPELLLSESKFLQLDSLQELIRSLVYASPIPESKRKDNDEDSTVFVLEMLLKITVQNRDRALAFWDVVREHLFNSILAAANNDMPYLLERSVVGLMRVALRLMRKEDMCPIILQSLKILLYLRPAAVIQLSQQMSFGLHEILKTTAANIHTAEEWTIIFTLLEYVGAGKVPTALANSVQQNQQQFQPTRETSEISGSSNLTNQSGFPSLQHSLSQDPIPQIGGNIGYSSGSDRGYTSDSELEIRSSNENIRNTQVSPAQSWILLSQDDQQQSASTAPQSPRRAAANFSSQQQAHAPQLQLERQLFYPDPKSLIKSCETLSFLVRDAAHITPDNFTLCVSAIRSFVEASTMKARSSRNDLTPSHQGKKKRTRRPHNPDGLSSNTPLPKSKSFPGPGSTNYDADESENEDQIAASHQVSVQLLDLLHTLHLRAAQIFQWWQKENCEVVPNSTDASIWTLGWKPILQTIVILCSDARKPVRTTALNYLQGALLVHDLQQLSATEWHSCFSEVLFPLMARLLEPLNPGDASGMEETRMRAVTLLSRVFLQHLTPLLQLESFTAVWLQILDFLDKYYHHSERSELLVEGIPESLKNLLLVMQTGGVFHTPDGYTRLWVITWEKIDSFLPTLRAELFRTVPVEQPRAPVQQAQPSEQTVVAGQVEGSSSQPVQLPTSPVPIPGVPPTHMPLQSPSNVPGPAESLDSNLSNPMLQTSITTNMLASIVPQAPEDPIIVSSSPPLPANLPATPVSNFTIQMEESDPE